MCFRFWVNSMEPIPYSDSIVIVLLGIAVLICAFFLERRVMQERIHSVIARKVTHVVAVGVLTIAAGLVQVTAFLALIVGVAELFILYGVYFHNLFRYKGRRNWGLVYFPLVYIALLLLFHDDRFIVVASMGLLALADAAATLFGAFFAKSYFTLTGDKKSILGSSSFLIVSLVWFLLLGVLGYGKPMNWPQYLAAILSVSLIISAAEVLCSRGRNSIWIPAIAAFLIWSVFRSQQHINPYILTGITGLMAAGAWLAFRLGLLNAAGAVSAGILGVTIWAFGGFSLWPMVLFFVTGSFLSKLPGRKGHDDKSAGPRDRSQVFANAGPAVVLALVNAVWPSAVFETLYLVAIAAATSDTWSSEIGTRLGGKPLDLMTFRRLPPGVSGGVTITGLLASVAGSACIAAFASDLTSSILVFAAGIAGSLADSVIGSAFQIRFYDENGNYTDRTTSRTAAGYAIVTNDLVNLLSICLAIGIAAAFIIPSPVQEMLGLR